MDLQDVLVHVMLPRVREFYAIEQLWEAAAPSARATATPPRRRRARHGALTRLRSRPCACASSQSVRACPPGSTPRFEDYARRLRGSWQLELTEIAPASRRQAGGAARRPRQHEARRILALLTRARLRGSRSMSMAHEWSTLELARWLEQQRAEASDLAFIIGGPDGLGAEVLKRGRACAGRCRA